MMQNLAVLWRGALDSCNYRCDYCPFAKRTMDRGGLQADREDLERFVDWVSTCPVEHLSVFFTPWGEALIHPWYQDALVAISHCAHVERVAIQTNASMSMGWTEQADRQRLALWATWHPSEVDADTFLAKVVDLRGHGVQLSVGAVACRDDLPSIAQFRSRLPAEIYFWLNAQRPSPGYTPEEMARMEAIDPHIRWNLRPHASRGRICRTGDSVIAVDGAGTIRRCHWVDERLGNIFQPDWDKQLGPRTCPRTSCDCHIGYVHLEHLGLHELYGAHILERIPIA
jgi:hypothetical protein